MEERHLCTWGYKYPTLPSLLNHSSIYVFSISLLFNCLQVFEKAMKEWGGRKEIKRKRRSVDMSTSMQFMCMIFKKDTFAFFD